MVRDDLNLFFDLTIACTPLDGPEFEQSHGMLPLKWRELYRWFWSFVITNASRRPLAWRNTPFSFSSRMPIEVYRQKIGAKKSAVRDFEKKAGANNLHCWLWTEAGDALFLDDIRRDHKVYHVRKDNLEDAVLLENADVVLDRYLAHVVDGGSPSGFDFRRDPA
jgi:hypothetical protein